MQMLKARSVNFIFPNPYNFLLFACFMNLIVSKSTYFFFNAKKNEPSLLLRCHLLPCRGCRTRTPARFISAWHPHVGKAWRLHHQPDIFLLMDMQSLQGERMKRWNRNQIINSGKSRENSHCAGKPLLGQCKVRASIIA